MELIGWTSTAFLALCGLPELIKTLKTKQCTLTMGFILMWFLGEVLGVIYSFHTGKLPLMGNYIINTFGTGILLWYKIKGDKND